MWGYISHELQCCVERDNEYILLVREKRSKITKSDFVSQANTKNGGACFITSANRFLLCHYPLVQDAEG